MRTPIKKITQVNSGARGSNKPRFIVIHFVGAAGQARGNANYFYSTYREASAHYFVDPHETYQVVEDDTAAWHVGDGHYSGKGTCNGYVYSGKATNNNSLGIEMCQDTSTGNDAYSWQIHPDTFEETLKLAAYLMGKYNIPLENVVRHFDVSGKNCPGVWNEGGRWTKWWEFKRRLTEMVTGKSTEVAKAEVQAERFSDKTVNWENWTGTVAVSKLNVRNAPNTDGSPVATYSYGETVRFDGWLWANGYRWGTYVSYSGVRRYIAYGEIGGDNYMTW